MRKTSQDCSTILKNVLVFSNLTPAQLKKISGVSSWVHFKKGEEIIQKGKQVTCAYVLINGRALTGDGKNLAPYFCIADYALLANDHYYENISAETDVEALAINVEEFSKLFLHDNHLHAKLVNSFVDYTNQESSTSVNIQRNALKHILFEIDYRVKLSIFIVYATILLSIYNILIEFVDNYRKLYSTTLVTFLETLFFSAIFFCMILQLRLPLSSFGLNLRNWKQYTIESLGITFLVCAILLLIKVWLVNYVNIFHGLPLFAYPAFVKSAHQAVAYALLYAAAAPVQEFFIRGAIQSPIMHLLKLRKAIVLSVVISTLVFSAVHIDLHFIFAIVIIPFSLLWALMYARQRSLLGVSISHAILGVVAFWILGFDHVINILYHQFRVD